MGVVGDTLQWLSETAIHVLEATSYLGLFLLMVAESMILPVPSEAVMPFAGVLIAQGKMSWTMAILASSAGSIVGSWLGYLMGQHGVTPILRRYGKYVLVQEHHIDAAQRWFAQRGAVAIFVCRFVPGVRHVISIPAGSAKMPMAPFLLATFLGATIWNTFLLWLGWWLANQPGAVAAWKSNLDLFGVALLLLLALYVVYEWRKGKKAKADQPGQEPQT